MQRRTVKPSAVLPTSDLVAAIPSPSTALFTCADAASLAFLPDESVHLVCTSPPYANLVAYEDVDGQLGHVADYDAFLDALDRVWRECARVLVPGGRIAIVVGDVLRSRKSAGRHHLLPLPADIQVRARALGLDCLTAIRWQKIANVRLEASRSARYLGKPNQPGGIIKSDAEAILLLRKPGGYRAPTATQREASHIPAGEYGRLFRGLWDDVPGQVRRGGHPAPFPEEIPRRLVRMFSFSGDVVLDPFSGTGTTALVAAQLGRAAIGIDVVPRYVEAAAARLTAAGVPVRTLPAPGAGSCSARPFVVLE